MSRDPNKLRVFQEADALVVEIYRRTRSMPSEERFGLQSQLRRAATSVPTNIVEGCARKSTRDYVHFMTVARSSAAEVHYLTGLCKRLGFFDEADVDSLLDPYDKLMRSLENLVRNVES